MTWDEKSRNGLDDDYTLGISRLDRALETPFNNGQIGVEFNSDETIDDFSTNWWNQLHDAVDGNFNSPHVLIDGDRGIVTGLVGLDVAHSPATELHPAYAVAINFQHDPPQQDSWAFFVRNWGDEGYCSNGDHLLPIRTYKFLIPWQPGAKSFRIESDSRVHLRRASILPLQEVLDTAGGPKGVLVTVKLAAPADHPLVDGQIHLLWVDANGKPLENPSPPPVIDCRTAKADVQALEDQENTVADSFVDLSGSEKSGAIAKMAALNHRIGEIIRKCGQQDTSTPSYKTPKTEVEANDAAATMSLLSAPQQKVFAEAYTGSKAPPGPGDVPDSPFTGPLVIIPARTLPTPTAAIVRMITIPGTNSVARIRYAYCLATKDVAPPGTSCPPTPR